MAALRLEGLRLSGQEEAARAFVEELPDRVLRAPPVLLVQALRARDRGQDALRRAPPRGGGARHPDATDARGARPSALRMAPELPGAQLRDHRRVGRPCRRRAAALTSAHDSGPRRSDAPRARPFSFSPRSSRPARSAAAPGGRVRWRPIAAGEAEAKKSGKPVLYFFTADWCGPCHLLEHQVFSRKDVAELIAKDFIPVLVRDEVRETGMNPPEMLALADRYGLRGFPTLVVSRPGRERNVTMEGWDGPERAIEFLKTARRRLLAAEKEEERPDRRSP